MVPLWIMPPPPCEASWSAEWAAMVTNVEKDNDYSEAEDGPEEYNPIVKDQLQQTVMEI